MTTHAAVAPATVLPLHLSLAGRLVVAVGAGAVAARKVSGCVEAGATVLVVAPQACRELVDRHRDGAVDWRRRCYRAGDLEGAWLVFTATGNPDVDRQVEHDASRQQTFCIRADDAGAGTARSAAVLRQDGVVISVGTAPGRDGSSPVADPARAVAVRNAIAVALRAGRLAIPPVSASRRRPENT